jgi:hypothetical protein
LGLFSIGLAKASSTFRAIHLGVEALLVGPKSSVGAGLPQSKAPKNFFIQIVECLYVIGGMVLQLMNKSSIFGSAFKYKEKKPWSAVQGNTQGWQHYQKEDPEKEKVHWAKFSNALVKGLHPMQRCYKFLFFFIQPRSAENEKTSSQYKRSRHGTKEPISRTKYPSPLGNRKHGPQIH